MLVSLGRRSSPEDLVGLFLECHERIRSFVRIAVDVGRRDDLPEPEIIDACERCERYFTEALPLHVEDEEQSMLPRLRGLRAEVDRTLDVMQTEHAEHELLLDALLEALRDVRDAPADTRRRERLATVAARLSAKFDEHLRIEEEVIFPAVRVRLAPNAQAEVIAELRARRLRGRT